MKAACTFSKVALNTRQTRQARQTSFYQRQCCDVKFPTLEQHPSVKIPIQKASLSFFLSGKALRTSTFAPFEFLLPLDPLCEADKSEFPQNARLVLGNHCIASNLSQAISKINVNEVNLFKKFNFLGRKTIVFRAQQQAKYSSLCLYHS